MKYGLNSRLPLEIKPLAELGLFQMLVDLRASSYEEWIEFVFDHPVTSDGEGEKAAWYWEESPEFIVDPVRQVEFLTRFCCEPQFVLHRYSTEQIHQGLCILFGPAGDFEFCDMLWNPEVSWEQRERCIESIPILWPQLFEAAPLEIASFMFWDSVAYGYYSGWRNPSTSEEDGRVQEAMRKALLEQLQPNVPGTQKAALHGLGHLCHPNLKADLRGFLAREELDGEVRRFAEKVLRGDFE